MTRIMIDGIRSNITSMRVASPKFQLVAGYDTGTADIKWLPMDWTMFPGIPHVHIDQGYGDTRSTEAHAMVFDVETNAFQPSHAALLIDSNTTARPTIYVDRFNLTATIASAMKSRKWKGDIWLAYPGWETGMALPPIPPGCRFVAVQNIFAKAFDLSTVIDDSWPALLSTNWTGELMKDLPTIGEHATGPFVRRVQALLVADALPVSIDGVFGSATTNAVKTVQRKAAIAVDGIVGQQTWPVLLGL